MRQKLSVFKQTGLMRRILKKYMGYYDGCRTQLPLAKDSPRARAIEWCGERNAKPFPLLGSVHHHYQRMAA
jgi:hypothetical protein